MLLCAAGGGVSRLHDHRGSLHASHSVWPVCSAHCIHEWSGVLIQAANRGNPGVDVVPQVSRGSEGELHLGEWRVLVALRNAYALCTSSRVCERRPLVVPWLSRSPPPTHQNRVIEYLNHQWDKHRLLVGEDSLGFMKSLSEPLQKEIYIFMVCSCEELHAPRAGLDFVFTIYLRSFFTLCTVFICCPVPHVDRTKSWSKRCPSFVIVTSASFCWCLSTSRRRCTCQVGVTESAVMIYAMA
jgi:hypothetical protein